MSKHLLTITALGLGLLWGANTLACEGMGKATHMGQLVSIDAAHKTFTITDAQSRSPITFAANEDILAGLKGYAGSVMVNYQENDKVLTAVGVTF
jgi:hypothetical protein